MLVVVVVTVLMLLLLLLVVVSSVETPSLCVEKTPPLDGVSSFFRAM
jgi:hypothetical protein